jgi:hypothetical protein
MCSTEPKESSLQRVTGGSSFKIVINFLRMRTETVCAVCCLCCGKFSCGSEWL